MAARRPKPTPSAEVVLEEQIKTSRALLGKAVQKGDMSNAVKAQALISRLSLDLERKRSARAAAELKDPLQRLQAMRGLAEADGSWVAAARLAADERDIMRERKAAESEAKARDLDGMSEDQVVEMVVSDLMELPLPLRLRIRQALAD